MDPRDALGLDPAATGAMKSQPLVLPLFLPTLIVALLMEAVVLLGANPPIREGNVTLRMPVEPAGSAQNSFTVIDAFPMLNFDHPVALSAPPAGLRWLFVIERPGRVIAITNAANPTRTVFLDISDRVAYETNYVRSGAEGLVSLAFHPNFSENGFCYLLYTTVSQTTAGSGMHQRLSRFQIAPNDAQAAPNSELPILTQHDEGIGHNWNDLAFGPDGYLYIAVGDEGGSNDEFHNSQRIDKDFFSGILRIDIDKRPGSFAPNPHPAVTPHYTVPPDNPFIGATEFDGSAVDPTKVRTELYAIGLRNPWRMSFDSETGALFCGDVGQHAAEEINLIVKGGNYGWAYKEGTLPGFKGDPPPGSNVSFIPPLIEYRHGFGPESGNAVIGGLVYGGTRLPGLSGAYIFGDYVTGNIWFARYDGKSITPKTRITGDQGMVAFGIDPETGDLLLVDHEEQKLKRLVPNSSGAELPATLADTGAFQNLSTLAPHPGILPYDVNVPFWSDGARKRRWFCVPDTNAKIGFGPESNWAFPNGTVWIKHFDLNLVEDDPNSSRRLETRFLIKNARGVYGVTYRWNEAQNDATLVPEQGMDEAFEVRDAKGNRRQQIWRYPARTECLACHTPVAGHVLGFNTAQLNRDQDYGGGVLENQLVTLNRLGYLTANAGDITTLRALAPADDERVSREYRVRSYLQANCAQCHQPGGPAPGAWDARSTVPLSLAGIIDGVGRSDTLDSQKKIVTPGSPEQSLLLTRIAHFGPLRMPPLATMVLDASAIQLLTAWITEDLKGYQTFADWQRQHFSSVDSLEAGPNADPDGDGIANQTEFLLGTNPREASSTWKVSAERSGDLVRLTFPQIANRHFEVQVAPVLGNPRAWAPLRVPANRPFFSAQDRLAVIEDMLDPKQARFYRVRVSEP